MVATQIFFIFISIWGFMIQFDEHIFSDGLVQPPTSYCLDCNYLYTVLPPSGVFFPKTAKRQEIFPVPGELHQTQVSGWPSCCFSVDFWIYNCLEPQTAIYKWLFQLDDSQSLHRKWLFHQTSSFKWLFGVPGVFETEDRAKGVPF